MKTFEMLLELGINIVVTFTAFMVGLFVVKVADYVSLTYLDFTGTMEILVVMGVGMFAFAFAAMQMENFYNNYGRRYVEKTSRKTSGYERDSYNKTG